MHDDLLTPRLRLRLMPPAFLEACLRDDFPAAEAILGMKIPAFWRSERHLMEVRLNACQADPAYAPWSVRAIGLRSQDALIGHIGFHTRPDPPYLREFTPQGVELGYALAAEYRRQGYASEAIAGMARWAHLRQGVERFVVSIAPDNLASKALAAKLGFTRIGGHQDEIDGYEDVYLLTGAPLARLLGQDQKSEQEPPSNC